MTKKQVNQSLFLVRTSRLELLTSCLSSRRSKPTELSPQMGMQSTENFLQYPNKTYSKKEKWTLPYTFSFLKCG